MIRLNLSIEHEGSTTEPYSLRLTAADTGAPRGEREGLYELADGRCTVRSARGVFRFPAAPDVDLEGDVFLVFPEERSAARLIRWAANSNTILLTEECDQRCVMCSQPPKSKRYDYFALYRDAICLAPAGAVIGISGGEPTLLKEPLIEMMAEVVEVRPDVGFHVLTNAQHFATPDVSSLARLAGQVLWGLPLYAATAEEHDAIVGKAGAWERLLEGLGHLFDARAAVELRTVLLAQNVALLPELAGFIATHLSPIRSWAIMQLEHFGYARLNWDSIFYDSSVAFGPVAHALSIAETAGLRPQLFNFPLCTVPPAWRRLAVRSISDWKQKYLPLCQPCRAKSACAGFFEWYPEERGFQALGAL